MLGDERGDVSGTEEASEGHGNLKACTKEYKREEKVYICAVQ